MLMHYSPYTNTLFLLPFSHNLRCDESTATGESCHVKKNAIDDCIILSGSKILQGVAKVSSILQGSPFYLFGSYLIIMHFRW